MTIPALQRNYYHFHYVVLQRLKVALHDLATHRIQPQNKVLNKVDEECSYAQRNLQ